MFVDVMLTKLKSPSTVFFISLIFDVIKTERNIMIDSSETETWLVQWVYLRDLVTASLTLSYSQF